MSELRSPRITTHSPTTTPLEVTYMHSRGYVIIGTRVCVQHLACTTGKVCCARQGTHMPACDWSAFFTTLSISQGALQPPPVPRLGVMTSLWKEFARSERL